MHAVSHFIGRDLIAQCLVFAIAAGLVELAFQVQNLSLAGLQEQLLLIGGDAGGFGVGFDLGEFRFQSRDVRLAGFDLLGAAVQAIPYIAQLLMNPMQIAQHVGRGGHGLLVPVLL